MKPFVILGTGSRDFPEPGWVRSALEDVKAKVADDRRIIVRQGACPTGADRAMRDWADSHPGVRITYESWDAQWRTLGHGAGPIRNSAMVAAGANVCLAFFAPCAKNDCRVKKPHWSHGTVDCSRKAKAAGIGVKPMFWQPETMPVIPKPDFL